MSSSARRQGGRELICGGGGGGSGAVVDGGASHSDSTAREMASRRFLRWRDAAVVGEGKEGEESGEEREEEEEKRELEDIFCVLFGDLRVNQGREREGGREDSIRLCDGGNCDGISHSILQNK
jgi:hypothetical protein